MGGQNIEHSLPYFSINLELKINIDMRTMKTIVVGKSVRTSSTRFYRSAPTILGKPMAMSLRRRDIN